MSEPIVITDETTVDRNDALIKYPLPLPGRRYLCTMYLPNQLTMKEVNRIIAILKTLAVDAPPSWNGVADREAE